MEKERALLHCFVVTELGLGLCSIASLNPSLSAVLALAYFPSFLFWLRKRERFSMGWVMQMCVVGVFIQPNVIVWALGGSGEWVENARFGEAFYGEWLWGIFGWVWAVVCGAQVLVGM
jgi:hypothetical protein